MFNFFKKKKTPENLKEVLSILENLDLRIEKLSEELENLKKETKFSIQKVGIVRFNPFLEIGGDQSFSIALLDGNNNGFVITNLYTREGNRTYAKPVKEGQSEYLLSKEEREAMARAQDSGNPKS